MNMRDLKNTISTICAFIMAICGALLGVATAVPFPSWVVPVCTVLLAVAGAVIGVLTGRNPDGTIKKNPKIV